jgi:polyhydroxyalkanoate synthesis regulator phasin
MADILKKGLLTAVGTASFAVEKADKLLKDIKKQGLINTKDAKSLIKKLSDEAMREKNRIQKIIKSELKKQTKKAKPLVSKGKKAARNTVSKAKTKAKKAVSKATKKIKVAQKRGKKIVRKAAKRLS